MFHGKFNQHVVRVSCATEWISSVLPGKESVGYVSGYGQNIGCEGQSSIHDMIETVHI